MKLSVVKKISLELLPADARKWFSVVAQALNSFLEQVTRALTNQLTISDNFKAQKYVQTIEATQTYPMKLAYSLNEKPSSVHIGQINTNDGSALNAHTFSWKYDNGNIEVTITGLSAVKHTVTFIAQV